MHWLGSIFYWQLAISWAYYIDHLTGYTTKGMIFYSQVIVCIWQYILQSWTVRNAALHPEHPTQQTIQSLAPQVHHLFSIIANDPALQGYETQLNTRADLYNGQYAPYKTSSKQATDTSKTTSWLHAQVP